MNTMSMKMMTIKKRIWSKSPLTTGVNPLQKERGHYVY